MNSLDVIIAVIVIAEGILVGLLISYGNEKQTRALQKLETVFREFSLSQTRFQRHQAAKSIEIKDAAAWFNSLVLQVCKWSPGIKQCRTVSQPAAIVGSTSGQTLLVLSPASPQEVREITSRTSSLGRSIASITMDNPLIPLPRSVKTTQLSALNSGDLFDLEAAAVWKMLSKEDLPASDVWYLYEIQLKK
jgi:hypothetical protein